MSCLRVLFLCTSFFGSILIGFSIWPLHASPASEKGHLVRIGIFTDDPETVRNELRRDFERLGKRKAGEADLGRSTSEGFYFHTFLSDEEIANTIRTARGRVVVNFSLDQRRGEGAAGPKRVILTVSKELPLSRQDHLRIFQRSSDPKRLLETVQNELKRIGVHGDRRQEIRDGAGDPLWEVKAEVPIAQMSRLLGIAVNDGAFEARFEAKPAPNANSLKVRYLIGRKGQDPHVASDAANAVHVLRLSLPVSNSQEAGDIRRRLEESGARKAGQTELGSVVSGGTYFHFSVAGEKLAELILFLAQGGTLEVERRPHPRRMPSGEIRVVLDVFSLIHSYKPLNVFPSPPFVPASPPPIEADPTSVPGAKLTEPIVRPAHISRQLEMIQMPEMDSPVDHQTYIEQDTPLQTYRRELVIKGFAQPGVRYQTTDDHVMVHDSTRELRWTLKNLQKGRTTDHRLTTWSSTDHAVSKYTVSRHPAMNLKIGGGALPVSTGGFLYIGSMSLRAWFDQVIGNDREPWEFQRFGIGFSWVSALNDVVMAEDLLPQSTGTFDLRYRLTPGLQEIVTKPDNYISVALSYKNAKLGGRVVDFVGFGGEYSSSFPHLLDVLVNWIPFLGYPKRWDLGFYVYPFIIGRGNSVTHDYTLYAEPKMYVSPRFYIFGRASFSQTAFQTSSEDIRSDQIFASGGLGYLF